METMPDDVIRFLYIEGYCQVSWMEGKFASACRINRGGFETFRVWVTDPSDLAPGQGPPPDAYGMSRCIQEIESGSYHGIVVVDYSNSAEFIEFEAQLGSHLQRFVRAGGVVAFPSSEGQLVSTFGKLFDTKWRISNYYRTSWGPCSENELNVNYSFGNGNYARRIIQPYSAKGVSLRNVPPNERCFGVTSESRTQSLVPIMNGQDVSKPDDPTSAAVEELDPDYDIVVAMHDYGKGCVAYFGDVNCETTTVQLVEAFLMSRCPQQSIDCFAGLDPDTFAEVIKLKGKGNDAFKQGKLSTAINYYTAGIETYGSSKGSHGSQRDTMVTLYANLALVHFRAKSWTKSEAFATKALELDDFHSKALYRRAAARYEISLSSQYGDLTRLKAAISDVSKVPFENPTTLKEVQKLLAKLEHERNRLIRQQPDTFRDNFAGILS